MTTRALAVSALLLAATSASATGQIYSTGWSNYTFVESELCGSPGLDNEAADDFDLVATVERVYVNGYNSCIAVCFPPPVTGVWVRFYEWTASGPGALQVEHFVPAVDPGFAYDPSDIQDLDITLPEPFEATGQHYVSVQLQFADCFFWAFWVANKDDPMGGPAFRRSNGGPWTQVTAFDMQSSDLSFALYGTVGPPIPPQGCGVWALEPSPNAPGMNQNWLNDLAYIAADDIWAVGRSYGQYTVSDWNQNTLAMHYDGNDWSIVPTPNPNPAPELTFCELNAVAALAPDDVWAAGTRWDVGGGGYVGLHTLVLHWDGVSWETIDAPLPGSIGLQGVAGESVHEILAFATDDIWFFGEWIRMDSQSFTYRHALAMHWDGSDFTVHEDFPIVGGNGGTIYAADAAAPDDIWAVGAAGDGDPAGSTQSFIFHWDGSGWSHVPSGTIPGYWHTLGDVKVLAPDDIWISGSSWAPPNQVVQFMLHGDGSGDWEFIEVPFAGGTIVGEPPEMSVFGGGGVSVFDGSSFTDAHLLEGLESLVSFGFSEVVQTGPCEMLAVGSQIVAGDAHTLVARLLPLAWSDLGGGTSSANGSARLELSGTLTPSSLLRLDLTGAAPSALAIVFVSFSSTPAPFFGGVLHAYPLGELIVVGTDPAGELHGAVVFPGAAAGQGLWFQVGIADPSVPIYGAVLSNGVVGTVP